jgi:hypothetical protein
VILFDTQELGWYSPRSGRRRVAQGESASPGNLRVCRSASPRSGCQRFRNRPLLFAAAAHYVGSSFHMLTQGSRTRPGLHAAAHYVG